MNLNFLICYHVCYFSAQVADFMSSVGNRLIGGKLTVALENCIGRPTAHLSLGVTDFRLGTCFACSVLVSSSVTQIDKFNY